MHHVYKEKEVTNLFTSSDRQVTKVLVKEKLNFNFKN